MPKGLITVAACALALSLASAVHAAPRISGDLPRAADLGFRTSPAEGGLTVRRLDAASAAARAGLRDGDLITALDGAPVADARVAADRLRRIDGGQPVRLTVRREGAERTVGFTPPAQAWEAVEGLDYTYGELRTPDGARLRTIVTRPQGATGPLPTLFFVQWVSCDPVRLDTPDAFQETYRTLMTRSGFQMIRVERSSAGDSEGPACHEHDWETELAHYRFAFERLTRDPGVDRRKVVVVGSSLGGFMAPFVAEGNDVAGVMISGGGALTHYERMLHFDRINLERREDFDPAGLDAEMRRRARFHDLYLLQGMTPEAIEAAHPDLAGVWSRVPGSEPGAHYGRPYAYHQQAAQRDPVRAWAAIEAPVLVVYKQFDQFETRHGGEVVARVRERLRPGLTRFVEIPAMSHFYELHPDIDAAYQGRHGANGAQVAAGVMLDWLARLQAGWTQPVR